MGYLLSTARISIPSEIREAFKGAADLIFPYRCAICGKVSDTEDRFGEYKRFHRELYKTESDLHICGKCLADLNWQDEDARWFLCLSNPIENDPYPGLALFMPFAYKGIVEQAVPRIKFGKQIELARLFGCILGSFVKLENIRADLVVPVPLSRKRLEERGFNQAGEIAYPVAKINNLPYARDLLIRTKDTNRQAEIRDANERANNVTGAFAVSDDWDVTGLTVLLVDDV
ncbi:MAG: hypothetical protein K6E12_00750, partial [Saccharofermentans sp.]|nr:hypothetical protein [Saccharofermentans sp.]